MSVREGEIVERRPVPALFDPPSFLRLNRWQKLLVAFLGTAAVCAVAFVAATRYPDSKPLEGDALEQKVAAVFGDPTVASVDQRVTGDLLVERFYILDVPTGQRYIADFLKGKIDAVKNVSKEPVNARFTFSLDLKSLSRDRDRLSTYVTSVSRPNETAPGYYMGLVAPPGTTDSFLVNYDGAIPIRRPAFRGSENEDLQTFLLKQDYKEVSAAPRLVNVDGYNYLLSSSDAFPLFKNVFGLSRAIFVSELVIIDTTTRANKTALYRLLDSYPPGTTTGR